MNHVVYKVEDVAEVRFLRVNITPKNNKLPIEIGEIEVFGKTN